MKVLVIGSGGREHALAWKLKQSIKVTHIYCAPGNPGIEKSAECVAISATDLQGLLAFARGKAIDLTVVGPEQPLAEGIVDLFVTNGLTVFGPTKAAARLEWSKAWAKDFMHRQGIPTAAYKVFRHGDIEDAVRFVESLTPPIVIKADGLAAGKGVTINDSHAEAERIIGEVLQRTGDTVVIEEFLEGVEASVFAITDGKDSVLLASAQDHKRALDDDKGKNTGGMGAYAPAPVVTPEILNQVISQILVPTLSGMQREGYPYKGCLYIGLMLTHTGPKVVEFNCRFGDPETQVILPLYDGDLFELLMASAGGGIANISVASVSNASAVCVVLASGGYPDSYDTGIEITGIDRAESLPGVMVFHAGTKKEKDRLLTAGGRVLGVTAVIRNGTIEETIERAYQAAGLISFNNMHYRKDIARKAVPGYSGVV